MTTATASPLSYRKTKSGEWVVFGPRAAMWDTYYNAPKGFVDVTKKDGTAKRERISKLGKTFTVDGVECCYGYIDRAASAASRRNTWQGSYSCGDCQDVEDAGDARGCSRHRGNPRN